MRATWITLLVAGIVPGLAFYVLRWFGVTESARFVATTTWTIGSPSLGDLIGMAATLATWIWLKGFTMIFALAAVPFIVADGVSRKKKAVTQSLRSPEGLPD